MASPRVERIVAAQRSRPIDGAAVRDGLASVRSSPDELVELLEEFIVNCGVAGADWLFPPVTGWLPPGRLDEVAEVARSHLVVHEGCEVASIFLAQYALRRPTDEPPRAWHFSMPADFLARRVDGSGFRVGHPTWVELADDHPRALLGGDGGRCSRCGGVAERLLLLPASSLAGIVRVDRDLVFVWCSWCSPYVSEATFATVNHDGTASMLSLDVLVDPGPAQQIKVTPETAVGLVDLGPAWYRQDWMWSNHVENLYRVGGEPTWIQYPQVPSCPDCGEPLGFIAQVDLADLTRGEGIAYLFWCAPSAVSAVVFQQT